MRRVMGWMAVLFLCCAASGDAGVEPSDPRLLEAQSSLDEAEKLQQEGKYAEAIPKAEHALALRDGDNPREARDFDRGERDRPGHCDASSPCQFEALPRQTNRSHVDRWPASPGDRFHLRGVTAPQLDSAAGRLSA